MCKRVGIINRGLYAGETIKKKKERVSFSPGTSSRGRTHFNFREFLRRRCAKKGQEAAEGEMKGRWRGEEGVKSVEEGTKEELKGRAEAQRVRGEHIPEENCMRISFSCYISLWGTSKSIVVIIASTLSLSGALLASSDACPNISSVPFSLPLISFWNSGQHVGIEWRPAVVKTGQKSQSGPLWRRKHPSSSFFCGRLFSRLRLFVPLTGCNSVLGQKNFKVLHGVQQFSVFLPGFDEYHVSPRSYKVLIVLVTSHEGRWLTLASACPDCVKQPGYKRQSRDDRGIRISVSLLFPIKSLISTTRTPVFPHWQLAVHNSYI